MLGYSRVDEQLLPSQVGLGSVEFGAIHLLSYICLRNLNFHHECSGTSARQSHRFEGHVKTWNVAIFPRIWGEARYLTSISQCVQLQRGTKFLLTSKQSTKSVTNENKLHTSLNYSFHSVPKSDLKILGISSTVDVIS
jgi:hypothetical protein